jgi:hypothetical protein
MPVVLSPSPLLVSVKKRLTAILFGDVISPSRVEMAASIAPSIPPALGSVMIDELKVALMTRLEAWAGMLAPSITMAAIIGKTIREWIVAERLAAGNLLNTGSAPPNDSFLSGDRFNKL